MKSRSLFVLCLSVALFLCQVDKRAAEATSKNFANGLNTKKLDDAGNRRRKLQQSLAAGGSCFNTNVVQIEIERCKNAAAEGDCEWRRNFRISNAFLTASFDTTEPTCCCACKRVQDCLGVHYITGKSKCVFHFGGEPESNATPGHSAWIKQ